MIYMEDTYKNELLRNAVKTGEIDIDINSLDIANTNAYTGISADIANVDRCIIERKTVININSINRELYTSELIPKNKFGFYMRDNGVIITSDLLNNEDTIMSPYRPYYTFNSLIYKRVFLYQTPSDYTVQLPKIFVNVKSIRLLSVEVPTYIFNITENNNVIMLDILLNGVKIDFHNGYNFLMIYLPCGKYNISEICVLMETEINLASGLTFTISYNINTGIIKINAPTTNVYLFHLKFQINTNSLWDMLGFRSAYELDSFGNDKYVSTLSNAPNNKLNKVPDALPIKYLYLGINNFSNIVDSMASKVDYFGKIIISDKEDISRNFINTPKIFKECIPKLDFLTIKWYDYAGNGINFNGLNHSFALEIIEYIDELDNIRLDTRRGISDKKYYPDIIKTN